MRRLTTSVLFPLICLIAAAPAFAQQALVGAFSVQFPNCSDGTPNIAAGSLNATVTPSLASLTTSGGSFSGTITATGEAEECQQVRPVSFTLALSGTVGAGGVISFTVSGSSPASTGSGSGVASSIVTVLTGTLNITDKSGNQGTGDLELVALNASSLTGSFTAEGVTNCIQSNGFTTIAKNRLAAQLIVTTQPALNTLTAAGGTFSGSVSGGGTITIDCPSGSGGFSVSGSISGTVSAGGSVSWTFQLNFTGADGGSFAISGSGGGTTSMLTANETSNDPNDPGSYSIVLSAIGTQGTLPPLQILGGGGSSTFTLSGGTVGTPYSQSLPVAGGSGIYTFKLVGGALPGGLTLGSNGFLSGTPTQPGGALFTVTVSDGTSSASSTFAVTIAPPAVTITTKSLPNASVNCPYPAQTLTASGGVAPYTFQVSGLPAGLTFANGVISGAATAAGTSTISVTVTDSSSPALTATAQVTLTVSTGTGNLLLSQNSVTFDLPNGASDLPPGTRISVQSSSSGTVVNYSFAVNPTVPWLTVQSGNRTPGAININLTPQAFGVTAASSQTSIVLTCAQTTPCPGGSQTITITLNRTNRAPQLMLTTPALSFTVNSSNPQPVTQLLGLANTGGGQIYINTLTAADSFVTITGNPVSLEGGPPNYLAVTIDPSKVKNAFTQSSITAVTSAGTITVPLTVVVTPSNTMSLNPEGSIFNAQQGSLPGNPNGSFQVSVAGSGTVNWTARVLPGASWLTLNTATGSSTPANPGSVTFTINSSATSLSARPYYAAIEVSSPTVSDSPRTYIVILNIVSALTAVEPNPQPAGLLFIAATGTPASQSIKVYAGTTATVGFQAASDSPWLSVSPLSGNISSTSPATSTISVNLQGLKAGVYRGGISYSLFGAAVRTVNVVLIVEPGALQVGDRGGLEPRATCTPANLVPVENGLVNSFSQPSAWPTPLSILLVNDCGSPVTNGQVVATFSNGDPPQLLLPSDTTSGTYATTWTPRNTAQQIAITFKASALNFPPATTQIAGQVSPNAAPVLTPGGTLNAFAIAAEPGLPFSPGQIVQIYGSNLAAQPAQGGTIPLPTTVNNTSVIIGGMQAPLYYVSPGQINAQIPFELTAGNPYQLIVNANGALSTPYPLQLVADSPGIAQFAGGKIIAQHPDYSLVTETAPAKPGEYLTIYLVGMGVTDQTVPSGTASPSASLANALNKPTLTLDGAPVTTVPFAGLTPTAVALYQVNFQVPPNAANGDLSLVITQASGVTNSTVLPVHN